MKKIFLVCYGAGHVNLLAPVFARLRREPDISPTLLALSVAKKSMEERALPHRTLSDYAPFLMDEEAHQWGERLADRWHVSSSGLSRAESVLYLGVSMRDLVQEVGERQALARIDQEGRQAFLPTETMERVIGIEKPDLIVTTNSPRMERAATLVGNHRGIPTLNLHDDLAFTPRNYLLTGDRIGVMSPVARDNLVQQGHDPKKIVVTGHPAFDAILEENRVFCAEESAHRWGLPSGPHVLLGTSQPGKRGEVMDLYCQVCETLVPKREFRLIVKPHPGEDADAYREHARRYKDRVTVVTTAPIRELVRLSDVLIGFASTILLESILVGKPIVSFNLTGGPDPLPFVNWGLGLEARNPDTLNAAVNRARGDDGFRASFLTARKEHFGNSVDGQATERVTMLIREMAGLPC